jgi:pimeloyl-ACP methyl ester carboxylesterase
MKPASIPFLTVASAALAIAWAVGPTPAQTPSAGRAPVETVRSKDGTAIAYDRIGKGPPLVLVGPALSDRAASKAFAALLAPRFTVFNYDRRGRGDSGDSKTYAVEREIEDLEAVIAKAGGSAFVFGSSSGAALALEASNKLAGKVKAQVLFEPPYIVDASRPPIPEQFTKTIDALLAADRRGDAVSAFMIEGIRVPEEMLAGMKQSAMWAGMEKRAHTLAYDLRIVSGLQSGKPLPAGRWSSVKARTLVLEGEKSDAFLRNAARAVSEVLPGSKLETLPGQDHSAVFTAPRSLVPVLISFFLAEDAGNPGAADEEAASRTGKTG